MTREEAEEEYNEQLDIEIRKYLESHKLPQQLVEESARIVTMAGMYVFMSESLISKGIQDIC